MKLIGGSDLAGFVQERHAGAVRALAKQPKLALIRVGEDDASSRYIRAKQAYGDDIGVEVVVFSETPETLVGRIETLNQDAATTGIVVQLPLPNEDLTAAALSAIDPFKDIDGLSDDSSFDAATPKAILWLLAGHNIDVTGTIAVVGQGRLVGKPLADMLENSGRTVLRCDEHTPHLASKLSKASIIVAASGQPGIITVDMVAPGTVIVDAGSPVSEVAPEVRDLSDVKLSPNPGGVGPMTVTALFDNLLIAAQLSQKSTL